LVALSVLSAAQSDVSEEVVIQFNAPTNFGLAPSAVSLSTSLSCSLFGLRSDPVGFLVDAVCYWSSRSSLVVVPAHSLDTTRTVLGVLFSFGASAPVARADSGGFRVSETPFSITPRLAAPSVLSATMLADGLTVVVLFDKDSSMRVGASAGAGPCSSVFYSRRLGFGSQCQWLSKTSLEIQLGAPTAADPSLLQPALGGLSGVASACVADSLDLGILVIRDGAVLPVVGSIAPSPMSCVYVEGPSAPAPPVVVLDGLSSIGRCDPVRLDASRSTGRGLTFTWSVVALNDEGRSAAVVSDIANPLYTPDHPSVLVVGSVPPGAQLRFSVAVTNFLSGTASASKVVQAAPLALPLVTIRGLASSAVALPSSGRMDLVAEGTITLCEGVTSQGLVFSWRVSAEAAAGTDPSFVVPTPTLQLGSTCPANVPASVMLGWRGHPLLWRSTVYLV
jgi:hypothetical protein